MYPVLVQNFRVVMENGHADVQVTSAVPPLFPLLLLCFISRSPQVVCTGQGNLP
jgi:hypothetical protein